MIGLLGLGTRAGARTEGGGDGLVVKICVWGKTPLDFYAFHGDDKTLKFSCPEK